MSEPRNYIQEMIEALRIARIEMVENFGKFKKGEMTKEEFEKKYKQTLEGWLLEDIQSELEIPNNGCRYQDTNPRNKYFKEKNY